MKSPKETSNELLTVLGSRDKQWSVLEKVAVRSQQDGLASFELTENFDRFGDSASSPLGAKNKTAGEDV